MRRPGVVYQVAKLRGLDPDRLYRDEDSGEVYSGAILMHAGLDLSAKRWEDLADGTCVVKHFTAL